MSRDVDPETGSSMKTGNSQHIYNDIVAALSWNTSELLDIEFLDKSNPLPDGTNVLIDGSSIAIPKGRLVQAFIVARKLFFTSLENFQYAKCQDIRDATAVILLMDPEHLTAANARKRLLKRIQETHRSDLENELHQELQWVNSMLISRSHRITKSPTLWGHRRWVLEFCQSLKMPYDIQKDLCSVILVSADRHPRNYYAWLHVRWLLQCSVNGIFEVQPAMDHPKLLSTVLGWCLRNPADTAGFSFLIFCLSNLPEETTSRIDTKSNTCREVLGLTNSFQWAHESVWVFLRVLVASGVAHDQKLDFFRSIENISRVKSENSEAQRILQAAWDWCTEYSSS